jgi:hypothetical protein
VGERPPNGSVWTGSVWTGNIQGPLAARSTETGSPASAVQSRGIADAGHARQFPAPADGGLSAHRELIAGEHEARGNSERGSCAGGNSHCGRQCLASARGLVCGRQNDFWNTNGLTEAVAAELKPLDGEAAGERPLLLRMGLGGAGSEPVSAVCRILRGVGDFSACRPGNFEAGSQIAAHGAQCVQAGGNRNAVQLDGVAGRASAAGQVAGEADVTRAERRVAEQVVDGAGGEVGKQVAVGVEVHGRGRSKLSAMDAGSAQPGFDLGCLWSAVEMQFAGEVATPSGVGAEEQPGELAELRLAPFQINVQRHQAQFRGLAQVCLQANCAGVALFKAEVGADGLAAQPDAPVAGTLLPEGKVGVEQGKRQFFRAILDVDAGVCGLEIGQPDGLAGIVRLARFGWPPER